MASNTVQWTAEQRAGIETTGSVLLSAAAGSGKTAVLAARCAHLVCDAPEPCGVEELLVVTFTQAAAAEMRSRIEIAIRQRVEQTDDPRLRKQLMLIDRAPISTLHSFCTTLLRQHFHILGLDPNFRVLDDEEVTLLRHDVARRLLDDRYHSDTSGHFQRFVDCYASGDDRIVLDRVIGLHTLLGSIVDRDGWLNLARDQVAEAIAAASLGQCALGRKLRESIRKWLADLRRRWMQLAERVAELEGLEAYGEYINEMLAAVEAWTAAFKNDCFDAISAEVLNFKAPALPRFKCPPPGKEQIQAAIEATRKPMKEGAMFDVFRFTEQQWRDGLKSIQPALHVLTDLVADFDARFATAKRELRGVDFSDLERFALHILRDPSAARLAPSAVAKSCRKRFKHVLVDEYQDINEVQDAILNLVSRDSGAAANLFCVGDVKQSIYRFRLADPGRFLERYGSLSRRQVAGAVIDLRANFRSREPLLNVINSVFERLMTRDAAEIEYDQSHRLHAGAKFPAPSGAKTFRGAPVELHLLAEPPRSPPVDGSDEAAEELDRTEREASFVARRIGELMSSGVQVAARTEDGSTVLRPLAYRDIVILLRSMLYKSEQFVRILQSRAIPVHSASATGFFESMEIRDMLAVLQVLDNQQQDIPLAAVLRSPLSQLPQPEDCLARLRLAYPDPEQAPFHRAVARYPKEHDDALAARLRELLGQLEEWRRMARQTPLADVIWHIYDATGYLAFCAGLPNGEQRVANLIALHDRARQFGSFQRQGLGRFMEFLMSLAEQSDLGQASVASEADDVVRVMSIHRSKGLEFPVVFVPDLGKKHNFQDSSGSILVDRAAGIGLMVADEQRRVSYPSLAHVVVQDRIKRQALAEEMRVLYVAMTRAKEHLVLVGTCPESTPDNWRNNWSSHKGPLPSEHVLGGRTMLDWIGPAAAAMEGSAARDRIDISWHGEDEVAGWSVAADRRAALSETQQKMARLEPLSPAPKMTADAKRLIDRLTRVYPHQPFTVVPAVQSVGALTKTGRLAPGGAAVSREGIIEFDSRLPAPRTLQPGTGASATEAGSATHLVLQHLDFARPCDRGDLADQIQSMLDRKLLDETMAQAVEIGAIQWLMETPLGEQLRQHNKSLLRELPVYFPMTPSDVPQSDDPLDRVMVRGRIDLLIPDSKGLTLVDFKTDRVTEQTVDARAEFYGPQLRSYRDAVAGITGQPVTSALLVFLRARIIRPV